MNGFMLVIVIVVGVLLYACASLFSDEYEKQSAQWEREHVCHTVDGHMYKCEEPTPTYWLKRPK